MQIEHVFQTKAHDLEKLFHNVKTLKQFMKNLETQSKLNPLNYDPDKYKGDGFEFFIELLLKLHPTYKNIGVFKYKPIQEDDNGVDGVGINNLLEKAVVQIKYRSNTNYFLKANEDHLSNFTNEAYMKFDVAPDKKDDKNYRHFIFTTAKGLHHHTNDNVFKGKVKCFNYTDIKLLIDNNLIFWEKVNSIIKKIIFKQNVIKPTKESCEVEKSKNNK